jgi:Trk K+ transport system NAD-binding subunit
MSVMMPLSEPVDLMLKAQSQTLRVEQIEIAGAPWSGLQLKDIQFHRNFNLLVLAVKSNASDQMWVNPPDTLVVRPGSAVILLGDVKDIQRAREEADADLRVTIERWHRRVGT